MIKKIYIVVIFIFFATFISSQIQAGECPFEPDGGIVYISIPTDSGEKIVGLRRVRRKDSPHNPAKFYHVPILTYDASGRLIGLNDNNEAQKIYSSLLALDELDDPEETDLFDWVKQQRLFAYSLAAADVSSTALIDLSGFIPGTDPIGSLAQLIHLKFSIVTTIESCIVDTVLEGRSLTDALFTGELYFQAYNFLIGLINIVPKISEYAAAKKDAPLIIPIDILEVALKIKYAAKCFLELSGAIFTIVKGSAEQTRMDIALDVVQAHTSIFGAAYSAFNEAKEATKLFWDVMFACINSAKKSIAIITHKTMLDTTGTYVLNQFYQPGQQFTQEPLNSKPEASLNISLTEQIYTNQRIFLDASDSSDPDGDPLLFEWQIKGPDVYKLKTFSSESQYSFIATSPGVYVAKMTVSDGTMATSKVISFGVLPEDVSEPELKITRVDVYDHPDNGSKALIVVDFMYTGENVFDCFGVFRLDGKVYRRLVSEATSGSYRCSCFVYRPTKNEYANISISDLNGKSDVITVLIPSEPANQNPPISQNEVIIVKPSGGEQWRKGSTHQILWSSIENDREKSYLIQAISKSGSAYKIGRRGWNKRTKLWNIPLNFPVGEYAIRISDWDNPSKTIAKTESFFRVVSSNQPPFAEDANLQVRAGNTISFKIDAFDSNDDPLSFKISTLPNKGSARLDGSSLSYTANPDALGQDRLQISISDGLSETDITIFIQIRDASFNPEFTLYKTFDAGMSGDLAGIEIVNEKIYTAVDDDDYVRVWDLNGHLLQTLNVKGDDHGEIVQMVAGYGHIAVITDDEAVGLYNLSSLTKKWKVYNVFENKICCVDIGEEYVYVVGKETSSDSSYQIKSLSLNNGIVSVFPYNGDPRNNDRDINVVFYKRLPGPSVNEDVILFTGDDDEHAQSWIMSDNLNQNQGHRYYRYSCPNDIISIFVNTEAVFLGQDYGKLGKYTLNDNKLWSIDIGDDVKSISSYGSELYASSGKSILVLSTTDGSTIQSIANAHNSYIQSLASLNNSVIVTGDREGIVKIWKREWNQPPVATAQKLLTGINQNGVVEVNVTDPDPDDIHSFSIHSAPLHGDATVNALGVVYYSPEHDFAGTDNVIVRAMDSGGLYADVNVEIVVGNRAPAPENLNLILGKNLLFGGTIDPRDNDMNNTHSFELIVLPEHGVATITDGGYLTYRPEHDFVGKDSIQVKVEDQDGASGVSSITFDVQNNNPVILPGTYIVPNNTTSEFNLPVYDINHDQIHLSLEQSTEIGQITVADPATGVMLYTPPDRKSVRNVRTNDIQFEVTDFTCTAQDDQLKSDPVAISLVLADKIADSDGDGIEDDMDNCPFIFNPDQSSSRNMWYYFDNDGDGYGDPNRAIQSCTIPEGYVTDNTDCNDSDANEHPGQVWYKDSDGDRYSDGTSSKSCTRLPGYYLSTELTSISGDHDDNDNTVYPGAPEICDGKDNNQNGQVDEGCAVFSTNDWLGNSTDWSVPTNWKLEHIPICSDVVLISNLGGFVSLMPEIVNSQCVNKIIISTGGKLTISSGKLNCQADFR